VEFAFAELDPGHRYKLLTALVVPRPIALVTTLGPEGVTNAAPYSFFNTFGQEPPLVVLGIERRDAVTAKDTGRNIDVTGEFVVNLVDEDLAEAMNLCAVDFPAGVSEPEIAGLELAPSRFVRPGRIARAPAALECRLFTLMRIGARRELVIGEVVGAHVRDGLLDRERLRIDYDRYRPVGRLCGDLYCRTRERFALRRRSYAEWCAEAGIAPEGPAEAAAQAKPR